MIESHLLGFPGYYQGLGIVQRKLPARLYAHAGIERIYHIFELALRDHRLTARSRDLVLRVVTEPRYGDERLIRRTL
jgi:hypothetical protein